MRVALALTAALSALSGTAGCSWGACNSSGTPRFDEDTGVSEENAADMVAFYGVTDRSELTCEEVCEWVVNDVATVERCSFELYPTPDEVYGDASAGWVECAGEGHPYECAGRRPLRHRDPARAPGLAGHLALSAHLEAASVAAFEELAAQLTAWNAPSALVARCRAAAADERVHARVTRRLAARHGARVPRPRAARTVATRGDVALHNAVEGCVNETWAALLAAWQADHAPDPALRALGHALAADELRHAELAWDLHDWLLSGLEPTARRAAEQARRRALRRLPAHAAAQAARAPAELGMPHPADAARIAATFAAALLRSHARPGATP